MSTSYHQCSWRCCSRMGSKIWLRTSFAEHARLHHRISGCILHCISCLHWSKWYSRILGFGKANLYHQIWRSSRNFILLALRHLRVRDTSRTSRTLGILWSKNASPRGNVWSRFQVATGTNRCAGKFLWRMVVPLYLLNLSICDSFVLHNRLQAGCLRTRRGQPLDYSTASLDLQVNLASIVTRRTCSTYGIES